MPVREKVTKLIEKGVIIPNPDTIEIGADVDVRRIAAKDVVLYPGTRLQGGKTLIGAGSKIGGEAPAVLVDCRLGRDVELRGGFFKDSLFLDRVSVGSGAQVREGCILEEESGGNHTIGLKQTILFPFVTLGSLINFCDCFMAGGTDRKNHSEVGSSFIHFNYTPNQDKATPSLLGDVPRGVMLDQAPIFLGGQGGIVGPVRLGYGTVTIAGAVIRKDCPEGGKILSGAPVMTAEREFRSGYYSDIRGKVINNIYYLANLLALKEWYGHVRHRFFKVQEFGIPLSEAAAELIRGAIAERIRRLRELAEKMRTAIDLLEKDPGKYAAPLRHCRELLERWPQLETCFTAGTEAQAGIGERDSFIQAISHEKDPGPEADYIKAIRLLNPEVKARGTFWLQSIVDHIVGKAIGTIPSFDDFR